MKEQLVNIMLVEDDEVDVMNLQRAFKKNSINHPLFIAGNGLEALQMLRGEGGHAQAHIKVILLDINMPKMNGIEFLRELRKDPKLSATPVFMITTSNEESDKLEAYKLNVAGYILKPVSFEKFIEAISTLKAYLQLIELP
jgi:CheY-like chemotaxis protein